MKARIQKTTGGYDQTTYRTIKRRWRSGNHVGEAKPEMRAYVRTTKIMRFYHKVPDSQIHAVIPGQGHKVGPQDIWKGKWYPKGGWRRLPNVLNFRGEQSFEANGVMTATIDIDNVGMIEEDMGNGLFHMIHRGYYAPHRGYNPPGGRPKVGTKNSWFDVLQDKSSEIMVLAGYGDEVVPVFNGLVNDLDITSRPDRMTLTCRDAGQVLTDQPVFINAKVRHVKDPITFSDRLDADNTTRVGLSANSDQFMSAAEHHPKWVLDDKDDTFWRSRDFNHEKPHEMPYIEIQVPHGRYGDFVLKPRWEGLECYVAVLARDENAPGGKGAKKHLGQRLPDNNWINEGNGPIPGTTIPWVKHIPKVRTGESNYSLPDLGYVLGDGSKIRLYFTNLAHVRGVGRGKNRAWAAGVIKFKGVRRVLKKEAQKESWILVDDLSDVVKTVFQWAGLNEWEVESTGVRLRDKAVFNRGNTLIDIINAAAEQVGYVFYMKPPESFNESEEALAGTNPEESMGIAVFRQSQAMREGRDTFEPVEFVSENTVLQGIQARFTDEPLSYNIRVRGKKVKRRKGGRTLGGDDTPRHMYVYRPPWSRGAKDTYTFYGGRDPHRELSASPDWRNGNIKKYVVHHDNRLRSLNECKIAALFIAFREALASAQATVEFPAMPTIHLDQHMGVLDTGTGLSTRVWVAARQIEFAAGPAGHFKMSVGGSLLDLPDIRVVRDELVRSLRNENYMPGLDSWQLEHARHVYRNADWRGIDIGDAEVVS